MEEMASKGLRVLGVAWANLVPVSLPPDQHDFDFEFLGLIGLSDPIRESVPKAISRMLQGWYPSNYDHGRLSCNSNQYC